MASAADTSVEINTYDVAVVGLGCHGSSIAAQLAAGGSRVLGLEKYHAVHSNGSSHGYSRIFRTAYFEDPCYVPLLKRALQLWNGLNDRDIKYRSQEGAKENGDELLKMCGTLIIGPEKHLTSLEGALGGTMKSVLEHELEHEVISAKDMAVRYPVFHLNDFEVRRWKK
jgi:sarcosine oxidase